MLIKKQPETPLEIKGQSAGKAGSTLTQAGFFRAKDNGINETWEHLDGSKVRTPKYGNRHPCTYKSGNTHTFTKRILGATNLMTMDSPLQTRIRPISAYATQQTYQFYEEGHTDHELRIRTSF